MPDFLEAILGSMKNQSVIEKIHVSDPIYNDLLNRLTVQHTETPEGVVVSANGVELIYSVVVPENHMILTYANGKMAIVNLNTGVEKTIPSLDEPLANGVIKREDFE